MTPFVLTVAGGTGSGKSTLAEALAQTYPGKTLTLHLDDYFRKPPELPRLGTYLNWDHPKSVYSHQLHDDLAALKQGQESEITQRDPDGVREYEEWEPRKRVRVQPKLLVILEGFLALHYPELRKLYDYSIYLDAPFETHMARRVHGFPQDYHNAVIKPMHKMYVLPSAQYADLVLDVSTMDAVDVFNRVVAGLPAQVTTALGR